MNNIKAEWWKIALVISAFLIAYSLYQFLVVIPSEKLTQEAQQNTSNVLARQNCLDLADENYNTGWSSNCRMQTTKDTAAYNDCITRLSKSFCESLYPNEGVSGPNCSLPLALANSLDTERQNARAECLKLYPVSQQ